MKSIWITAALAVACLSPDTAHATSMTKTYRIDSTFTGGPVATLSQYVTLTFDPALRSSSMMTLADYSSSSANAGFQVAPVAQQVYRTTAVALYVYGSNLGMSINPNVADFLLTFDVTTAGALITARMKPYLEYSPGGVSATFTASSVSVVEASLPSATAVPEPSTWGTMLLGFIGMAAALRSGRRQPVLRAIQP